MPKKPQRKTKKQERAARGKKEKSSFLTTYGAFSYRVFGGVFESRVQSKRLEEKLRRANLPLTPPIYMSMQVMSGVIALSASLFTSILVFLLLLDLPEWVLYVAAMVVVTTAMTVLILPLSTGTRVSNRKSKIDRELPFTLSELSILASTGLSPIEVIRRMANRDVNPIMSGEFKRILFKVDVEGKDLITALGEVAKETPSDMLRESLWDLSNMIHQGGNLDIYLRAKADEIMNLKRSIQKEFIDKLTTLSDVYVSLVLIGVLFIGIAAFLVDALATTFGGIDAETLLILLTYFIIPVAVFVVALFASTAHSKAE